MKNISEMYRKKIVATDGRVLGTLEGVAVKNDWTVSSLTVKIADDAVVDLGRKKPFLGNLRLDVGVAHIQAMGDNIVLNKPIKDMGRLMTEYRENNDAAYLLKKGLVDAKGRDVGEVEDIIMDDQLWNIPAVLVSVNKDISKILKVKSPMLSNRKVSVSTAHISGAGDKVMLSVTTERLGEILQEAPVKAI
jgi:sporulation protein YlmC with PRC-barrel domain